MLEMYFNHKAKPIYAKYPPIAAINQFSLFNMHKKSLRTIPDAGQAIGDFKGFCNNMVNYWFKRITNDKLTWLSSNKSYDELAYDPHSARWQKKTAQCFKAQFELGQAKYKFLQSPYEDSDNDSFEPTPAERAYVDAATEIFLQQSIYPLHYSIAQQITDSIMALRIEDDTLNGLHNKGKHILIRGAFGGGKSGGHAFGIHRMVKPSSPAHMRDSGYASLSDEDWEIVSRHDSKELIHYFDPNIGEFYLAPEQFPHFLMELINSFYHSLLGPMFTRLRLSREPIYW